MADYQAMYLTLMRATEEAIRALIAAQQACEELYLQAEETVIPFSVSDRDETP